MEKTQLIIFLGSVFSITLTGALMPGPVTTAAIVKGHKSGHAGALMALGHGVIEIPLITSIALGLSAVFESPWWKLFIGVVGGAVLVWMGVGMVRDRAELGDGTKTIPLGSLQTGALTTASNPYFFIWWATVGALLITQSLRWGIIGVMLFILVHWSVDLVWLWILSFASHRGKSVMSPKIQAGVFAVCGAALVAFGLYFLIDGSGLLGYMASLTL